MWLLSSSHLSCRFSAWLAFISESVRLAGQFQRIPRTPKGTPERKCITPGSSILILWLPSLWSAYLNSGRFGDASLTLTAPLLHYSLANDPSGLNNTMNLQPFFFFPLFGLLIRPSRSDCFLCWLCFIYLVYTHHYSGIYHRTLCSGGCVFLNAGIIRQSGFQLKATFILAHLHLCVIILISFANQLHRSFAASMSVFHLFFLSLFFCLSDYNSLFFFLFLKLISFCVPLGCFLIILFFVH